VHVLVDVIPGALADFSGIGLAEYCICLGGCERLAVVALAVQDSPADSQAKKTLGPRYTKRGDSHTVHAMRGLIDVADPLASSF
jgi:hypothetical protein